MPLTRQVTKLITKPTAKGIQVVGVEASSLPMYIALKTMSLIDLVLDSLRRTQILLVQ